MSIPKRQDFLPKIDEILRRVGYATREASMCHYASLEEYKSAGYGVQIYV